jgi:DNA-binding MarR family transcriptional regulator
MGPHAISRRLPSSTTRDADVKVALDGIRRIVQALRASSRAVEKKVGLSAAQLFVLLKLSGEEALSINELAARTLTHQSSVSVVVTRLVEQGLVARRRSSLDGRRVELTLTRRGRAVLSKAPQAAQDRLIEAIESLPRAERRALARNLDRVSRALLIEGPPTMLFEDHATPTLDDDATA